MKPGYDNVFFVFGGWSLVLFFKAMSKIPSSCSGRFQNLATYSLSPFDKALVPVDAYIAYQLHMGKSPDEFEGVKKASMKFVFLWLLGPAWIFLGITLALAFVSLCFFFIVLPIPNIAKGLMLSLHSFSIFNAVPVPLLMAKDVLTAHSKSQLYEAHDKIKL